MNDPGLPSVVPLPDRCDLRRPDPARGGLEARLASAAERRRTAATGRLDAWFDGLEVAAWAGAPGPRQPVRGATRFDDADGGVLELERLAPRIALGTRADGTVAASFRTDGAELVPSIGQAGDDLSSVLAARVDVSFATGVVADEWYDHDLLVIAVGAPIAASLTGPAGAAPLRGVSPDPTGTPAWQGTIAAGGYVLVPRGWALAVTGGVDAARFEVAVRRHRGTDVAAYVADRSGSSAAFREEAPWDPDGVVASPDSIYGDPDALRGRLSELDLDGLAAQSSADWAARLRSCRSVRLADLRPVGDRPLELVAPGGVLMVDSVPSSVPSAVLSAGPPADGMVRVALAGHLVTAEPDAVAAVLDAPVVDVRTPLGAALAAAGLLRGTAR